MSKFTKAIATISIVSAALALNPINVSLAAQDDVVTGVQNSAPLRTNPDRSQRAGAMLREYASGKFKLSWDNDKKRIIQIGTAAAKISPADPDFIAKRESLAIEAMLIAKANIIEAFQTTASADNILAIPGNPVGKQLAKEQGQLVRLQRQSDAMYAAAKKDVVSLMSAVDKAQADELAGATWDDKAERLLEGFIKKIDASYNTKEISAEEKQRVDDLKLRLKRGREYKKEMAELKAKLDDKLKAIRGNIKKEQRSSIETLSSLPIMGATLIQQAESYNDLREDYEIAVLMVWSLKLEKESRSILLKKGKLEPKPNRRSLGDWLARQNLNVMVGPRRYLAADGSINFMGISAIEFDPDDPGTISDLTEEAKLWAKQTAILSVVGDMESHKKAERLRQDVIGKDGKTRGRILKDFSLNMRNSVKGLQLRGLEIISVKETIHPASGRNIIVAVANINSGLALQSNKILSDTFATLREVNAEQSYEKGQLKGMKEKAAETKNNAGIIAEGRRDGAKAVEDKYENRKQQKVLEKQNNRFSSTGNSKAKPNSSQSGVWKSKDKVKDDF